MRAADSIVSGATSQAATRHAMRRRASRHSAASVRPTTRMAIDSSGTTTLEISSTEVPMVRCLVMISQPFLLAHCRISLLLSCTAIALVSKNAWSGNPTGTGNGHAGYSSHHLLSNIVESNRIVLIPATPGLLIRQPRHPSIYPTMIHRPCHSDAARPRAGR